MQETVFVLSPLTAQIYGYKHDKDEYIHSPKTGLFHRFSSRMAAGCQWRPEDRNNQDEREKNILTPLTVSQSLWRFVYEVPAKGHNY